MKEAYERATIEIIRFVGCTDTIMTSDGVPTPETDDD